jgi:hypothetical protein
MSSAPHRAFQFERDTFTFANELVWLYDPDPATGTMKISRNPTPPAYTHRCFVMVRSARQFFFHARFDPALPACEPQSYRSLIRQVVRRNPRRPSPDADRIVFPGYSGLRAFCREYENLLKAECGSPWESYFVRSHWRMVFPIWRAQQHAVAEKLQRALRRGTAPAIHLFLFPRLTINHGIILYSMSETSDQIAFDAYDPNVPSHPVKFFYERRSRQFTFPPARYWPGGPLNVIEIFRRGLY